MPADFYVYWPNPVDSCEWVFEEFLYIELVHTVHQATWKHLPQYIDKAVAECIAKKQISSNPFPESEIIKQQVIGQTFLHRQKSCRKMYLSIQKSSHFAVPHTQGLQAGTRWFLQHFKLNIPKLCIYLWIIPGSW